MSGVDGDSLFEDTVEGSDGQGSYEPQSYASGSTYRSDISIPIWEDAASYEGGAYQLRVQRQNPDGSRSDLGHIAAGSSEDALIATWPQAGTFYIMPVDEHGVALRDRPYKKVIDNDHLKLRTYLAQAGGGNAGGGGDALLAVVVRMMEQMQADRVQVQADRVEERQLVREREVEERRLSRERDIVMEAKAARVDEMKVAMLIERESQGLELQTKMMDDNSRRNDHAQSQLMQFMEASTRAREAENRTETARREDAVREDRQRRQEDGEHRLENERSQREMMRLHLQADADRREHASKADADRREQAAKEQAQRFQEQLERERRTAEDRRIQDREDQQRIRDRDIEFNRDRLEQIRSEKNPLQAAIDLGETFGLTKQDMLEKVMGAGQKSALESLATTAGDVFKSVAASGALGGMLGAQTPEFDDDDAVGVKLPDGNVIMVPREELAGILRQSQPAQIAPQQPPVSGVIDGSSVFGKSESEMAQNGTPVRVEVKVAPKPPKVPVKVAKPARKAIRMLVGELAGCAQEEWVARIIKTATATPEVIEYLKAVTVRGALSEAGAEDTLISAVIANLDNPEYATFTANLPRG